MSFEYGALIELREDLSGVGRRHVRDELEGVVEGGDDEGIVVREGTLEEVEARAACVEDDHAWCIGTIGVDDRLLEGGGQQTVDVGGREERRAGLAPVLGSAAVQVGEVELLAVLVDGVGYGGALGRVEAVIWDLAASRVRCASTIIVAPYKVISTRWCCVVDLRRVGVVFKRESVPIEISPSVCQVTITGCR